MSKEFARNVLGLRARRGDRVMADAMLKLCERSDVLLALSAATPKPAAEVRRVAGLDCTHPNVTIGHLRKLRTDGLVYDDTVGGWRLKWPAGAAAADLLRMRLGR